MRSVHAHCHRSWTRWKLRPKRLGAKTMTGSTSTTKRRWAMRLCFGKAAIVRPWAPPQDDTIRPRGGPTPKIPQGGPRRGETKKPPLGSQKKKEAKHLQAKQANMFRLCCLVVFLHTSQYVAANKKGGRCCLTASRTVVSARFSATKVSLNFPKLRDLVFPYFLQRDLARARIKHIKLKRIHTKSRPHPEAT